VTALPRLRWAALAALVGLLVALPYLLSSFWIDMATQALYLGLFALSINLLAGFGGMVTLGQAGVGGVAGYAFGIGLTHLGLGLTAAAVLALVACVAAAALFGLLAVRTSGVYFLMITLAEGMIVWGIAQRWTTFTGGDNGLTGIDRPGWALEYWQYYYLTLAIVALCTALIALIVRSPFGLSLKGIRESEGRMAPLGYNVYLHKLAAFVIAGFFAGVSTLLLAMYNNFFSPVSVHLKASADGLLMSILGGMATLPGAFVGSSLYVFVTNYVSTYLERWPTLLGLVFVLTILFARDGVVGAWNRLVWERWTGRVARDDARGARRDAGRARARRDEGVEGSAAAKESVGDAHVSKSGR
jgi:branched-chain amino acid transport system permease protein